MAITIGIFFVVIIGYAFIAELMTKPTPPPAPHVLAISDVDISKLYALTNDDRARAGLPALRLSSTLQQSANDRCNDMVTKNYYSHTAPDGTQWYTSIQKYTYYQLAGENLASYFHDGSAEAVNTDWMNSEEHKKNILTPSFTDVSYAVCKSNSYLAEKAPALIIVEQFIQEAPVTQTTKPLYCSSFSTGYTVSTSCQ